MSHPAPSRLYDLREWLLDMIDGSEETRGDDSLISHFISQINAQDAELADLKQRILPQFQGRAQRAEHERDALLEQLIEARSATAVECGYDRSASLAEGRYVCTCGTCMSATLREESDK
jgi:hypothetical protein